MANHFNSQKTSNGVARGYLQVIVGRRRLLVSVLFLSGCLATVCLMSLQSTVPLGSGAWSNFVDFFAAAIKPTLTYESQGLIAPDRPLLIQVLRAVNYSLAIAVTSIFIAVLCSVPLVYVIVKEKLNPTQRKRLKLSGFILGICQILRAIHELIWAVVFLIVFGFSPIAAIIALSLTATGILTKIFSEILIETDTAVVDALKANGVSFASQFIFGLLPNALADLVAYMLYQLECAVRSSAVMGVLGLPTLGYFILQSHENLYFREVWTYMYALVLLMAVLEVWNKMLCQRLRAND